MNTSHRCPTRSARTGRASSFAVVSGGHGLQLVLVYWALMLSLIAFVGLVAAGFAFGQGWSVILGILALRVYAWVGRANSEILARLLNDDG